LLKLNFSREPVQITGDRSDFVSEDKPELEQLKSEARKAEEDIAKLEALLQEAREKRRKAVNLLEKAEKPAAAQDPAAAAPKAEPADKPAETAGAAKPAETGDSESVKMLNLARETGRSTIFDRAIKMKPCNIGAEGICCKICAQGPCRLPLTKAIKDGSEPDKRLGLCGATPETIAARNLIRMISAGSSAHADHGLALVETLQDAAKGEAGDHPWKAEDKLKEIASKLGLSDSLSKDAPQLAADVAEKCLSEFGKQTGEL
jgi:ATPase subunit of ABC transporter with duplicated ATPase domains